MVFWKEIFFSTHPEKGEKMDKKAAENLKKQQLIKAQEMEEKVLQKRNTRLMKSTFDGNVILFYFLFFILFCLIKLNC